MNRRQAKKALKKEYGIITPRYEKPRLTKRFTLRLVELMQKRMTEKIDNLIINGERGGENE